MGSGFRAEFIRRRTAASLNAMTWWQSINCFLRRFPILWEGDGKSTFEAMAKALRGGPSLTLSGLVFASHDIGGFEVRCGGAHRDAGSQRTQNSGT
jgi:hypothetical protein